MFAYLLLGHLLGDYVFQTEWMAWNKFKNSKVGWLSCFSHCLLYSFIVTAMVWYRSSEWILAFKIFGIVFLSHFPIDKFSLAKYWLKALGRKLSKESVDHTLFYWIVYVVVDNTLHLTLMVLGLRWLGLSL